MSESTGQDRPISKVPIEVYADKVYSFWIAITKVRVFYEKHQDVPDEVVKELFDCIKVPPRREIRKLTEQINTYTDETISYFKTQQKYKYEFQVIRKYNNHKEWQRTKFRADTMNAIKKVEINKEETEYTFNLASLLEFIYSYLIYEKSYLLIKEKRHDCIIFIYEKIEGFLAKLNITEEDYGHYKRCVITGYIASKFEFTMTRKQYGTNYNEYLFRSINKIVPSHNA